ncbi:MAG: PEP-CTERM sorting domain-containing protein [Puniceicoccaceae bacterium]|nr:MAG: PEP-CTERM sorting domain-containing protein [Puniceicoccaceae bacterium]
MIPKKTLSALVSATFLFSATVHAEGWIGWMNVFENDNGSQGGFVFGSEWGVADLQTTLLQSNVGTYIGDQLELAPNFNAYNPDDAFWSDGAGGGNKFMEANTYVEVYGITMGMAEFMGTVDSYTLDAAYGAIAFIKVLDQNAGWSLDVFEYVDLASTNSFALASDLAAHQGKVLQLGFAVTGLNANPAMAEQLGNVVVTVVPEPSTYALILGAVLGLFVLYFRRR